MNNRIKEIRDHFNLSRAAFGERLGVSGDVINNLERGRVDAKEHMILLICKEYDINEEWLRTGEGEMFSPINQEKELAKLTVDFLKSEPESFRRRFISYLSKMSDEQWRMVEDMVNELATKKESKE